MTLGHQEELSKEVCLLPSFLPPPDPNTQSAPRKKGQTLSRVTWPCTGASLLIKHALKAGGIFKSSGFSNLPVSISTSGILELNKAQLTLSNYGAGTPKGACQIIEQQACAPEMKRKGDPVPQC